LLYGSGGVCGCPRLPFPSLYTGVPGLSIGGVLGPTDGIIGGGSGGVRGLPRDGGGVRGPEERGSGGILRWCEEEEVFMGYDGGGVATPLPYGEKSFASGGELMGLS
jgi:hypothetical protein